MPVVKYIYCLSNVHHGVWMWMLQDLWTPFSALPFSLSRNFPDDMPVSSGPKFSAKRGWLQVPVHQSPDITVQTFTGLDYNHKPIQHVLVFADCENRWHNHWQLINLLHPAPIKSKRTMWFTTAKNQSLIVGLFCFFLAHLKCISL